MRLKVLGSSSKGNGYILSADGSGEAILLEAGLPLKEAVRGVGYMVDTLKGCFITHEHGDHIKHVREVLEQTTMPVYMSSGTMRKAEEGGIYDPGRPSAQRAIEAVHGRIVTAGGFTVMPIECSVTSGGEKVWLHDAAEPMCYQIHHSEMGTILFATDLYCLPSTKWTGLSGVMVECNYDTDTLKGNYESGRIPKARYDRAWVSHMGCDTLCRQLAMMDLAMVTKIVLLHCSGENGNRGAFERRVEEATGRPAITATAGLVTTIGAIH